MRMTPQLAEEVITESLGEKQELPSAQSEIENSRRASEMTDEMARSNGNSTNDQLDQPSPGIKSNDLKLLVKELQAQNEELKFDKSELKAECRALRDELNDFKERLRSSPPEGKSGSNNSDSQTSGKEKEDTEAGMHELLMRNKNQTSLLQRMETHLRQVQKMSNDEVKELQTLLRKEQQKSAKWMVAAGGMKTPTSSMGLGGLSNFLGGGTPPPLSPLSSPTPGGKAHSPNRNLKGSNLPDLQSPASRASPSLDKSLTESARKKEEEVAKQAAFLEVAMRKSKSSKGNFWGMFGQEEEGDDPLSEQKSLYRKEASALSQEVNATVRDNVAFQKAKETKLAGTGNGGGGKWGLFSMFGADSAHDKNEDPNSLDISAVPEGQAPRIAAALPSINDDIDLQSLRQLARQRIAGLTEEDLAEQIEEDFKLDGNEKRRDDRLQELGSSLSSLKETSEQDEDYTDYTDERSQEDHILHDTIEEGEENDDLQTKKLSEEKGKGDDGDDGEKNDPMSSKHGQKDEVPSDEPLPAEKNAESHPNQSDKES